MLFISGYILFAQVGISKQENFKGIVVDDSTGKGISYVHLFNESKRCGAVAGNEGEFTIPANQGDTIAFIALGYLGKALVLSDSSLYKENIIRLPVRIYEINPAYITAFRSYKDFKRKFIELELPEINTLRKNLEIISKKIAMEAYNRKEQKDILERSEKGQIGAMAFTFLYPEHKQLLQKKALGEWEKEQIIIDSKYNREIVRQVTKLSDDKLTDFILFCDFHREFLLNASELDIIFAIERKYKIYKKLNESGKIPEIVVTGNDFLS